DTKLCRALSLQGIVRGASDYQIGKLSAAVRDYGAGMLPTFWDAAVARVWSVRGIHVASFGAQPRIVQIVRTIFPPHRRVQSRGRPEPAARRICRTRRRDPRRAIAE